MNAPLLLETLAEWRPVIPSILVMQAIVNVAFIYKDQIPEAVMRLEMTIWVLFRIAERCCRYPFVFRV
jgi:hypothetical protein